MQKWYLALGYLNASGINRRTWKIPAFKHIFYLKFEFPKAFFKCYFSNDRFLRSLVPDNMVDFKKQIPTPHSNGILYLFLYHMETVPGRPKEENLPNHTIVNKVHLMYPRAEKLKNQNKKDYHLPPPLGKNLSKTP